MKFSGKIGFVRTEEQSKGVWLPKSTEVSYYGDVMRNYRRREPSSVSTNDNVVLNNQVSIVADSYLKENVGFMRYIVWNGVKWKIESFTIEWPRITIEFGSVYNE